MRVELPTKNGLIPFQFDTSAYAEYRYEQHFKKDIGVSFTQFVENISKMKDENAVKANFLSVLKVLYCYLESDQAPTFISFIKMFDLNNSKAMLDKISEIFAQTFNSAVKN